MEQNTIQPLIDACRIKLAHTSLRFKRYLYVQINWDVRLIGIKGARGVGKTTLLLQHIKESFPKSSHCTSVKPVLIFIGSNFE